MFSRLPLDKFHVIAVDLPGHGFSQKHAPGMSYTITDGLVLIKKTQVRTNGIPSDHVQAAKYSVCIWTRYTCTFEIMVRVKANFVLLIS